MLEAFKDAAANIDWLNNFVSALMGLGMAGPPILWAYFKIMSEQQKQKKAIHDRNLFDDNCPFLETTYEDGKQKIRARGEINLRTVFTTHTDTYVGYIHKAAQLAFKSDNPNLYYHLRQVIPPTDYEDVMYDISAEIRKHVGAKMYADSGVGYGPERGPESVAFITMVAEKSASRQQIRFLLTYEEELTGTTLPDKENLSIEIGPREFISNHDNAAHLKTRKTVIEQLQDSKGLQRFSWVGYPAMTPRLK